MDQTQPTTPPVQQTKLQTPLFMPGSPPPQYNFGFSKIVFFVLAFVALVSIGAGGYYLGINSKQIASVKPTPIQDGISCTADALECPDGSFVGRSGPKCEFSACPTRSASSSAVPAEWKTYEMDGFSFKYPPSGLTFQESAGKTVGKLQVTGGFREFATIKNQTTPFAIPQKGVIHQSVSPNVTVADSEKTMIKLDDIDADKYLVHCNAPDCYVQLVYFTIDNTNYEITFDIAGGRLSSLADEILSTFKFTK